MLPTRRLYLVVVSDTDGGAGFHAKTIYQVYPKSFYDSTGNGVGDLRGVIEKVDYIASLGVDMVWFNPFFASPQVDNGYDIADYCSVDPSMGTMADFDELVAALEARGIGVMLDMVLNHTSTAHEWFQRALSGDPEYQDFYYLRPGGANGELPNNWVSKFGGPAWARFGDSDLYYLHLFDRTQADLNWHNPRVRHELAEVVEFWRLKGVRGFRFDGRIQLVVATPDRGGAWWRVRGSRGRSCRLVHGGSGRRIGRCGRRCGRRGGRSRRGRCSASSGG